MRSLNSCLLLLLVYVYVLALLTVPVRGYGGGGGASFPSDDPYRILGVHPFCSQDEIKASYRRKCLLTHPDKTLHLSESERKSREDAFKKIQRAYERIGDPDQRKRYDADSALNLASSWGQRSSRTPPTPTPKQHGKDDEPFRNNPSSSSSNNGGGPSSPLGGSTFGSSSFPFGVPPPSGVHFTFWKDADFVPQQFGGTRPRFSPHPRSRRRPAVFGGSWVESLMGFGPSSSKVVRSVFVQNVPVPLEDLYSGTTLTVPFQPGFVQRTVAAFRGNIGPLLLYESLLFALPLLRFSRIAAAGCALFVFHRLLHLESYDNNYESSERGPNKELNAYSIRILPGYKGGTKITYDQGDVQVVFVLREMEHQLYWRVGNDLHTSVTITPRQAKDGCIAHVSAIDRAQPDISVRIPPGLAPAAAAPPSRWVDSHDWDDDDVQKMGSNTMVVVEGRGWPIRRPRQDGGEPHRRKGDLIVHVHVHKKRKRTSD